MKLHVKLMLANDRDEEFLGGGLICLLEGIQRNGSIHQAALEMGLSYVKALKILNRMEREVGRPLLIRHKGGAERGSTTLTPYGACCVKNFAVMRESILRCAEKAFAAFQKTCGEISPGP
ncbi:MAG: LysR family transcriptional regulator [Verrucomicrobiota bacterium]|jgi:molybdate transport system regulatory protein|nr:LysR family transcriptional regulator [Verrucomicrobiota bacterium]